MKYYQIITNNFPGGLFKSVQEVSLFDERPFQHEFFLRIAESFPFMKKLTLINFKPQKHEQHHKSKNDNKDCSIIEYHHLTHLDLMDVNVNYVEEFLDNTKTSFKNHILLNVRSRPLRKGTHNFTKDCMRVNCAKLSGLHICGQFKIPEHLKAYFPNVNKIKFSS
jgi:hypothetical protein